MSSSLAHVYVPPLVSSLSPLEHLFAYCNAYAALSRWPVQDIGKMHYLESRIPHSFFNWIFGYPSRLSSGERASLVQTLGAFPATWICDAAESPAMQPFLDALPLVHIMQIQGVDFDLTDLKIPDVRPVPDLEIRRVTSYEEMGIFDRLSAPCFEYEEGMALEFMRGLPARKTTHAPIETYLIYVKGQPQGCYQTFSYEGHRGLYWGGVTPQARGQGIASAAFAHVLKESAQMGYPTLLSQLMPASFSLVERFSPRHRGLLDFYVLMP